MNINISQREKASAQNSGVTVKTEIDSDNGQMQGHFCKSDLH